MKRLRRKLFSLLKLFINKIFSFRGLSLFPTISTYNGQRAILIKKLGINFAIDVGANIGQWALETKKLGFDGELISLEPDPNAFRILKNQNLNNWKIIPVAAGDRNDSLLFNDWGVNGGSSSFLPLTASGEKFTYKKNASIPQRSIEVKRLDTLFKEKDFLDKHTLLKIDVQGYEKQVLEGAKQIIKHIEMIEIEVPVIDIYDGASLLPEILIWLNNAGFEVCSIQTERWTGFGAADVDVLLIRKDLYNNFIEERAMNNLERSIKH